jgi:hypothetical protein
MNVRAKFVCVEVKKTIGGTYDERGKYVPGTLHGYRFNPVSGNSEENKKFFSSTPSGVVELHSVRDDLFELGKEYYLDFTPYVPPAPVEMPMAVEAEE